MVAAEAFGGTEPVFQLSRAQPNAPSGRLAVDDAAAPVILMATRIAIGGILALGLLAAPIASVYACSCAGFAGPVETAEASELAFIGTVVDARPGAQTMMGQTVAYAFEIERASVEAPAQLVVHALHDPGGSACGFVFEVGDRWFVSAATFEGTLNTGLCSGNVRLDAMAEGELNRVMDHLPVTPMEEPATSSNADSLPIVPVLLVALAGAGMAVLMLVAFRRPLR
jgi:hypothetical protein